MKFPLRFVYLVTILVATSVLCFSQAPAKEATASVSGRVTISGKPAAGVTVVASLNVSFFDNKTIAKTATDEDGNYKLTGLTAGKFNIFPLANAYVVVSGGAAKGTKQSVNIAEGEAIVKSDGSFVLRNVAPGRYLILARVEGPVDTEKLRHLISWDAPARLKLRQAAEQPTPSSL